MTAAINLAKKGYKVDILDSNAKIGGVMRYCIPKFRLPDEVLDNIMELLFYFLLANSIVAI